MTNKTTEALKLAEEALELAGSVPNWFTDYRKFALAAIREALAEHPKDYDQGFVDGVEAQLAEPVKQEPVVYYAYATIKEYEELAGFSVSEAFRVGWNMARTTNSMLGINAAPVQPVKQKPVGEVDLHKELGQLRWMGGDEGWDNAIHAVRKRLEELYAAPVDAKTIRAETLEEAAKVCEQDEFQIWETAERCAAAIRARGEK